MSRQANNKNLKKASKNKNDEFYTQLVDIERELKYYKAHFRDKVVYCNCDDPRVSNFFKYFYLNFEYLELKKLMATCYKNQDIDLFSMNDKEEAIWLEYNGNGNINDFDNVEINNLKGDGDFRSEECIELLKQADVVVTNPPFSLFREYIGQLVEYDKKFLVIGNINCLTYKEIFALIKENKAWLGNGMGRWISGFIVPKHYELYGTETKINEDGERIVSTNNCLWLTNLDIEKRHDDLLLYENYTEDKYPMYVNYDAINVDKTNEIPMDYDGIMGVPITFLDKYNPNQFEIVELGIVGSCNFKNNKKMEILKNGKSTGKITYNAKGTLYRKYNKFKDKKTPAFRDCETGELYTSIYARILIKRK